MTYLTGAVLPILVLDDDKMFVDALMSLLTDEGYPCEGCTDHSQR